MAGPALDQSGSSGAVARAIPGVRVLWFLIHLGVVYVLAIYCTPWLAGWVRGTLIPLLNIRILSSHFEFLFSHLMLLTFIPAFVAGVVNGKFRHRVAEYVWLPPALILAFKIATFPKTGSVLFPSHSFPALHEYFGGDFMIPGATSWQEFWMAAGSSDMARGMAQLQFTAPVYAGIAYSLAVWLCFRTRVDERIGETLRRWGNERFPDRSAQEPTRPGDDP